MKKAIKNKRKYDTVNDIVKLAIMLKKPGWYLYATPECLIFYSKYAFSDVRINLFGLSIHWSDLDSFRVEKKGSKAVTKND